MEALHAIQRLSLLRVPVPELERRIGYRFHSSLDRSTIGDLCEAEGCNVSLRICTYIKKLTENLSTNLR